jgi:hypothetical protein
LFRYSLRAEEALKKGQKPLILYCGDFDPSGLKIQDNIYAALRFQHNVHDLEMYRFALVPEQLRDLVSIPLKGNRKTLDWYRDMTGQNQGYELDALHPKDLQECCYDALEHFTDMEVLKEDEIIGDRINDTLIEIEQNHLSGVREEANEKLAKYGVHV